MKKAKSPRIKIKLPDLKTRADAEAAMDEVATASNAKRKFIAVRDQAVLAINEKFAPALANCDQTIAENTDALRVWAETHPEEFPKGRKSIELAAGTLGFRTGTPKLCLLSRAWTWEKALTAVRTLLPAFIRDKPEIDKDAILGQRDEPIIKDTLPRVGLKVDQGETFYIEPALSDTDARQSQEAA